MSIYDTGTIYAYMLMLKDICLMLTFWPPRNKFRDFLAALIFCNPLIGVNLAL